MNTTEVPSMHSQSTGSFFSTSRGLSLTDTEILSSAVPRSFRRERKRFTEHHHREYMISASIRKFNEQTNLCHSVLWNRIWIAERKRCCFCCEEMVRVPSSLPLPRDLLLLLLLPSPMFICCSLADCLQKKFFLSFL